MPNAPAYDLFVSHAEADRAWVEGALLPALGLPRERVITPDAFALGAPVVDEYVRAVTQSRYTLLVLSPAFLADAWASLGEQLGSYLSAEGAEGRVIPLRLRPVDLPLQLRFRVPLDLTAEENRAGEVARLRQLLAQPPPAPEDIPCPYPGMKPFGVADHPRFFGRTREREELLQRLRKHRFLCVIGPSGSGKSSLVFAGLVPDLRASGLFGPGEWLVRSLRPGETPHAAPTTLVGGPETEQGPMVSELAALPPTRQRLLLIVDQFEELFTVAREGTQPFQEELLRLAATPDCWVVLTVRADFYPDLMAAPVWPEVQAHRLEVLPLNADGLREAVRRPAEGSGVYVEEALVERLVADAAGEPGVLPLVQETLVLLWERRERRYLPLSAYEGLARGTAEAGGDGRSGLQVAIADHAEAAFAALSEAQRAIARRVFLRLIQFGEGRADTRRQLPVAALRADGDDPALFEATLQHLVVHRLITLSGGEGSASRGG
jgi:hypothetical protein